MVTTHHVVLTAVGVDRPGLVDEVARYVLEREATSRTAAW